MHAWADCPIFLGVQEPALVVTSPGGNEIRLDSFGANRGFTFSGPCSAATTGPEYLGVADAEAPSEAGSWSIRSQGSFTGDVQLVVVGHFE